MKVLVQAAHVHANVVDGAVVWDDAAVARVAKLVAHYARRVLLQVVVQDLLPDVAQRLSWLGLDKATTEQVKSGCM